MIRERKQIDKPNRFLLGCVTALATMGAHTFVPALPSLTTDFDITNGEAQMAISFYLIGLASGQLIFGPLSDRYGRRPILLLGMFIYALSCGLGAISQTFDMLLACRFAQAFGGCAGLVVSRAIVRDTYTGAAAVGALSVLTLSMTLSSALAPMIGDTIERLLSWRYILGMFFIGAIAAIGAVAWLIAETLEQQNRSRGLIPAASGLLRVCGDRLFLCYSIAGATATVTLFAPLSSLPFILINEMNPYARHIASIYVLIVAGGVTGAFSSGIFSRTCQPTALITFGMSLSFLASCIFLAGRAYLPDSLTLLMLPMFLVSFSGGFTSPSVLSQALGRAPGLAGSGSSVFGCIQMGYGGLITFFAALTGSHSISIGWLMVGSTCLGSAAFVFTTLSRSRGRQRLSDT